MYEFFDSCHETYLFYSFRRTNVQSLELMVERFYNYGVNPLCDILFSKAIMQ
jgi:hypothetical protein